MRWVVPILLAVALYGLMVLLILSPGCLAASEGAASGWWPSSMNWSGTKGRAES